MNKKKIVKTAKNTASIGNNIIVIKANTSKGALKPLGNLCKALAQIKSTSQVYLVGKDSDKWTELTSGVETVKACFENGSIKTAQSLNELELQSFENLFFLPLSFNRDSSSYSKIISKLSRIEPTENGLYGLGKNTFNKRAITERVFGFFANGWARIIHGINTPNIASGIIGFGIKKFNALRGTYGEKTSELTLLKLGIESGNEIQSIDGDFGNDAFGIGAGFSAIIKSKLAVAQALPKRFIQAPLAEIKEHGLNWKEGNSPVYKLSYFFAAILLFIVMMFTATDFNATWDEPGHIKYGEDIASYMSTLGDDTTVFVSEAQDKSKGYVDNYQWYGASIDTISHAIHSITGGNIYNVRRYMNGIVSFLMLLMIALLAKHFFGWRAALLALLAGFFSPSFHGHFFNNHKDIPFALGYIMTAYFLIQLLSELPKPKYQTMFMLALGVGFSLSVRASGLAQFGFVFAFLGLHWLLFNKEKGKAFLKYIGWFLAISVTAYIIGISLWPSALRNPISGPLNAFKEFSNFQSLHYMELFEGVRLKDKPWYYEPKLILITAPLMLVIGWAFFALTSIFKKQKARTFGLFVLLVMAFAPTAYAIFKESYLYNGWRHFIFIYPILIVLAVWGWEKLIELLNSIKITKIAIPILAVVLLIPAAIFQIKNHPYHYMYYNELVGGIEGANGNYEFDYWSQTPREAMEWMTENIPEAKNRQIRFASNNIGETFKGQVPGTDSFQHIWCREMQWYDKRCDYVFFTTRTLSKSQILNGNWPPKGTVHEIKIDGVTIGAVAKKQNDYAANAGYLVRAQKLDTALGLMFKAYQNNPKEEEYARGIADIYKGLSQFDSALFYYQIASELKDHNYEASFGLAQCYLNKSGLATGQAIKPELVSKTKKYLEETIKNKSNFYTAYYFLGYIAQTERNDYAAISYFRKTIAADPNADYAYKALGQSYASVGKLDSAIIALSTCMGIEEYKKRPNPDTYRLLADAYQKQGNANLANQVMQRYQQLFGSAPTQ